MVASDQIVVCKDYEEIKNAIIARKSIIWDNESKPLYEVLEDIVKDLKNYNLFFVRACRELNFTKPIKFYPDGKNKIHFKEYDKLSSLLIENPRINENSLIEVTSNDPREAIYIIQQLINIDISCEVYTSEDLKLMQRIENLWRYYAELVNHLKKICEKFFDNHEVFQKLERNLKETFEKALTELEKIKEVSEIKLAIIATKKAGKSTVVNALLGEEYAPTSVELPTPNVIIYIPSDHKDIVLEYRGDKKIFSSVNELKDEIEKEFKRVKLKGEKLSDMVIYYPFQKENAKNVDKIIRYYIYDTPGPDLACSEHSETLERVIKEVDLIVFVIDYAKHAQESELNLINILMEDFLERRSSIYSMIFLINKIDLLLSDTTVEKVKVRIADFFYSKYRDVLKVENILVLPCSALIDFYVQKITEKYDLSNSTNIQSDLAIFKKHEEDHYMRTYITTIQNISNSLESLLYVDPTIEEVKKFANFDKFRKYLHLFGLNKAKYEKLKHNMNKIEIALSQIRNTLEVISDYSKKEKEKIESALKELNERVEEIKAQLKPEISSKKEKVYKTIKDDGIDLIQDEMNGKVKDASKLLIEKVDKEIKKEHYNSLKEIGKQVRNAEELKEKVKSINDEYETKIHNEYMVILNNIKAYFQENSLKIPQNIKNTINEINNYLSEVNLHLKNYFKHIIETININYDLNLNIRIPDVTFSVPVHVFMKKLTEQLDKTNFSLFPEDIEDMLRKKARIRFWIVDWILDIVLGEKKEIDWNKFNQLYEDIKEKIEKDFSEVTSEISASLSDLEKYLINNFNDDWDEFIEKSLNEYLNSIQSTYLHINDLATLKKEEQEKIIEYVDRLTEDFKVVMDLWQRIYAIDSSN